MDPCVSLSLAPQKRPLIDPPPMPLRFVTGVLISFSPSLSFFPTVFNLCAPSLPSCVPSLPSALPPLPSVFSSLLPSLSLPSVCPALPRVTAGIGAAFPPGVQPPFVYLAVFLSCLQPFSHSSFLLPSLYNLSLLPSVPLVLPPPCFPRLSAVGLVRVISLPIPLAGIASPPSSQDVIHQPLSNSRDL